MKWSTSYLAGLVVRSASGLIAAVATIGGVPQALAQPFPCDTWNSQVPQVPAATTPALTYGVRKPGEGGIPFYRWERLDGTPPTDPLGQHDFLPTCWWSLAQGWGAGDVLDIPIKLGFTDPQTSSPVRLPDGFAININPLSSPSIGDYLPAAPTVGLSALPLLPPGASGLPTGWQGSTRPVLEGAADLVTGLPLTQVTDLELPMDGATFRLTRTRSAILSELDRLSSGWAARQGIDDQPSAMGRWWDWLGVGWMASENPVLLIDSAVPDIVGPSARTCYLAIDAHHSIPFQQVNLAVGPDGRPRVGYEAPPRFRARMTHNGLWGIPDGQGGYAAGWATPPTQYEIWLYDGAVKYTFVAIREDVPPNVWDRQNLSQTPGTPPDYQLTSYHDTPLYGSAASGWDPTQYDHLKHPGFGIPHYGICVRMEDRFGHVAEIEYCNVTRESIDDPDTEGCTECQQLCLRKGQIRHIKLKTVAGSQETVHWTLLYVHRLFAGDLIDTAYPATSTNSETASVRGMSAIDRIYVYKGDPLASLPALADACLAIPASDHPYRTEPTPIDPAVQWSLPGDWVHQVRYFYPPQNWSWMGGLDPSATEMAKSPVVVMTQVDSRRQNGAGAGIAGTETHRYSFYRYSGWVNARSSRQQSWLERVYTAEDYDRMLAWADEHKNDQGGTEATARRDLALFLLEPALKFAFADISVDFPREGNLPQVALGWLEGMASVHAEPWGSQPGWPLTETAEFPSASTMRNGEHDYLRDVPATRLVAGFGQSTVRTLSARTSRGELRHYRLFHMLAIPDGPTVPLPSELPFHVNGFSGGSPYAGNELAESRPLRSLFYHPYRWFSAPRYGQFPSWPPNAEDWTNASDMSEVRWVRVIDEFASTSDRDSNAYYSTDDRAVKPGQLSRRVVSMNAAGYILTDRTWEFRGQDVVAVGGGLGETYKYKSAQQYFADIGTPLPAPPTNGDEDPVASVRNEALLVQHRSVGWSAVAPAQQQSDGLVRDFEYDYYSGSLDVPWQSRIRLIAESVRKGTAGTKLYTKRLFYGADQPTDLIAEVMPLGSEVAGTRPDSIPEYPSDPSVAFPYSVTRWVSVRPEPQTTPTPPRNEWPVSRVINISPPRQVEPGSAWYYPVQMQVYDTQTGLAPWTAAGLVRSPESPTSGTPDAHESLILAYTTYDGWGRPVAEVADALPGSTAHSPHGSSYDVAVPNDLPAGWGRIGATDALNWVTHREYDAYGPTDIYLHNGRRWARRTVILRSLPEDGSGNPAEYREEPDDPDNLDTEPSWGTWTPRAAGLPAVRRDFVFNDLESTTGGWVARSPGQVLDYARAAPADQIFRPIDGSSLVVEWLNARENSAWQQAEGTSENFYIAYSRLDRLVRQPGPPLRPIRTRKVTFVQQGGGDALIQGTGGSGPNFLDGPSQPTQPHFRRIADVKYVPDQYGRLTDASLFERNADGVMAPIGMKQVNDLGEVYREREMDGTITRLVKNSLGHVLRRYVGTRDDAWLTVTGENATLPFSPEDESDNNLVLVERTEYGTEPTNAWLPKVVRRYTTNTGFSGDWHLHPYAPPPGPGTDPHGQPTRLSYDWRMRPVRIDRFEQGEPSDSGRLTTTLTFLDHAGRERLVVTYGRGTLPTLGTDRDPSLRSPTQVPEIPTPSQFLQANELRPLSITETTYGPDGGMTARLAYDVAWAGSGQPPYQAEYQFAGFGGITVFRQGPGDEAERTVVDSLARVKSTATVIPTSGSGTVQYLYEVARTDYTYDADSNAIRTDRWERVIDSGSAGNSLGTGNAVWSSTVNWYDVQKRLVATAEVGTGQTSFVCAGDEPEPPSWYSGTSRPSIDPVAGTVDRQGVPADIPLTVNSFNRKGELEHVAGQQSVSNGQAVYSFTRNVYTGFGQIARTIEHPFGPSAQQRTTSYYYRFGRLAEVHADQQGTTTAKQQTKTLFGANPENNWGADVIDMGLPEETTRLASRSGALPRSMHLPKDSGLPDPDASVTLRYDFFGRLAERIDARGVVIRYTHDELDRLVSIEVGHYETDGSQTTFSQKHPESLLLPNSDTPVDRVGYVQFDFGNDHRTVDAYAYDIRDGNLIAHARMEYDARGNLVKDWQGIGALLGPFSPRVTYAWDVQFASASQGRPGRTRLASMTYPVPPSVSSAYARVVTLGYGGSGTSGDVLSRVASITSTPTYGGDPSSVAAFTYVGTGRRARADIAGGAIVADLGLDTDPTGDNTIGLSGLDRFGRLTNLVYRQGSPSGPQTLLTQLQYTYDLAGNRLSCTRTPRPIGVDPLTRQEQANAYDILDRLTSSGFTNYNASNNPSLLLTHNWTLDTVGNWNSLQTILPGSVETLSYDVDTQNKYTKISPSSGSSQPAVDPLYDASGNLVFDGVHAFQYDGFGRVVQVNRASLPANVPPEIASLVVGPMVKHYTYDAFGRLIRVQSPFPDPESGGDFGLRVERLYYDGLRRIQEVNIDPSISMNMAASGEAGGEMQAAANQVAVNAEEPLDGSAAPATLESQALESEVIPATVTYLAREYVWGPGDWGADELLAQYDTERRASWPLQDAGGDVIALCDRGGANGTARVITQIVYDAHGAVIDRDDPYGTAASAAKELRVGHKGLFFDRLDAGISDPVTGAETPRLWPGARLSGYARNRTLHCDFGRWNQPDPNRTGLPVQQAVVFHGSGLQAYLQRFDLRGHFADGPNVYQYIGGMPFGGADSVGLEWSFPNLLTTMAVQGTIAGTISGTLSYMNGGSFGGGFAVGFVAGALGGAAGFAANTAFAASASGLWATISAHVLVGAADGAISGGVQSYMTYHDARMALADAMWGALIGGATGGLVDGGSRALFGNLRALIGKFAPGSLKSHFAKHAGEWGGAIKSEAEYLSRARQLLSQAAGGDILEKIRPNGDILRFNAATNEFAVMASDGTIRTFFKPKDGIRYWQRQ